MNNVFDCCAATAKRINNTYKTMFESIITKVIESKTSSCKVLSSYGIVTGVYTLFSKALTKCSILHLNMLKTGWISDTLVKFIPLSYCRREKDDHKINDINFYYRNIVRISWNISSVVHIFCSCNARTIISPSAYHFSYFQH